MDKLDDILEMQDKLDEYIAEKYGLVYPQHIISDGSPEAEQYLDEETSNWLVQMCLCLHSEVNELQNETHWKHWKVYDKPLDHKKIQMELTDILFFTLSSMLKVGMTAEDIHSAFKEKYEENVARQQGKSKEGKNYGR